MRQTNTELVTDIMTFSQHGAMSQLVVMEAIENYVNKIVDVGLEKLKEVWGENHFINPDAWFATCEEIKKKLDKRGEADSRHGVDVCPDGRETIDPDICGSCEFYNNCELEEVEG